MNDGLVDQALAPSDIVAKAFQLFFLTISFIIATGLNGIVAYSLLIKRRLLIAGNCFVFSLTASNFVDSFLSIPFLICSGVTDDWSLGNISCVINAFMHLFISVNSNLTLALIALDRWELWFNMLLYSFVMFCILNISWLATNPCIL